MDNFCGMTCKYILVRVEVIDVRCQSVQGVIYRDAHRSTLYDMIHIKILIYDTYAVTILITMLQGTR